MPLRPLSPCSFPGCPARATVRGRCAAHQRPIRPRKPDHRGTTTQQGYGYEWQRIRNEYIRRYPNCASCGKPGNQVDHIRSRAQGGTDGFDNLQTLCASCHSRKTARHDGGFGNGKRLNVRR